MSYFAYVVLALALLFAVLIFKAKADRKHLLGISESVLSRVYTSLSPLPQLDLSWSYGYPAFQVMFPSKPALQAAADAGLNQAFKQEIGEICKGRGPKGGPPFSAEQGVFFTYVGQLEEDVAKMKQVIAEERRDA